MAIINSLYLSQFYKDSEDDYYRSLTRTDFPHWDRVVITASNERQAEYYRLQLKNRVLPGATKFEIIADVNNERIGSGGATLAVIRHIFDEEKLDDNDNPFLRLKILVIHSGGDSKRIPQYSALGKLFSPVPRTLGNGSSSTLFDEILCAMSSVPSRIRSGMFLLSGDVLLLFNPLLIDYQGEEAAVISFKESAEKGKNHGVFVKNGEGYVKSFLHKQSVENLKNNGAVNENGAVDIDTGALLLSPEILSALNSLVDTDEKFSEIINNKVRLSLYGDIQYALAEDSTLEKFYLEKGEGDFCPELKAAREKLWNAIHNFRLRILCLSPAQFIHFGTSLEYKKLMTEEMDYYSYLGWKKQTNCSFDCDTAGYNSVLSPLASVGKNSYLEVSYIHSKAKVGENCIISYTDIYDESIPDGVILHTLKTEDGFFVCRILGIDDNPKEDKLFGVPLKEFADKYSLSISDDLWNSDLYVKAPDVKAAVKEALNLYNLVNARGDIGSFKRGVRVSLKKSFEEADSGAIIEWNKRMYELVAIDSVSKAAQAQIPSSEIVSCLGDKLSPIQSEWYERKLKQYEEACDYKSLIRLYHYVGTALGGSDSEKEKNKCYTVLQKYILENKIFEISPVSFDNVKEECEINLPLRVNFGGGWSDTPPYCNENGGTVINAAVSLSGALPVYVSIRRINEKKIRLCSDDMNVRGEFDSIDYFRRTGDPYDSFALQKAALIVTGVINEDDNCLNNLFRALNGGFELKSEVFGVPKGSGLGTSSILGGAVVKALLDFFSVEYTEEELYDKVLTMEQIMSTGGGWQDQIGGLSASVKYITSKPGIQQKITVQRVEISEEVKKEFDSRFALIYTGQRRLARNLLRDVVGRYIGNDYEVVNALNEIQKTAALMRFELERDNFEEFANLLNKHWEYSKIIDSETTNTLIEQIFDSVSDLIDARMICGAGGGGFLQVIMKKGVTGDDLHNRLKEVFSDSMIDVWDAKILFEE